MKKDEIWEKIKEDGGEVYGQSTLDMFLKTTNNLEPRHYKQLNPEQRSLLLPEVRLRNAETAEDVKRSVREMGSNDRQYMFDRKKMALRHIAGAGNEEALEFLMKDLENSDVPDREENTREDLAMEVMRGAAEFGNKEIIRKYLDKGFKLENSLFYYAAVQGQTELLSWLCQQTKGQLPMAKSLEMAVEGGRIDTIKWIMDNHPDAFSHRLVGLAAQFNRLDSAECLLKNAKLTPEVRKMALDEALLIAAHWGRSKMVEWLLKMGADEFNKALLRTTQFGSEGHIDSARMLIAAGATELESALYITTHSRHPPSRHMRDLLSKEIEERKERKRNAPAKGDQP